MNQERYNTLTNLLLTKKNIILQGAPGVGKTYAAKRLAYSIMGEKDTSRVKMVQFHQSYSYEDLSWVSVLHKLDLNYMKAYFTSSAKRRLKMIALTSLLLMKLTEVI